MKTHYAVITLATLLLMSCATATTKVNTDWDREADFSKYHSYAFSTKNIDEDGVVKAFFSLEVGKRLEEKGLHADAANPDLLVFIQGSVSGQIQFASGHMGYQPSAGWSDFYGWGFGGYGGSYHVTRNVAIGTIIVDIVEAEKSLLVWRSLAEKSLNSDNADPDRMARRITSITKTMFQDFPNVTKP